MLIGSARFRGISAPRGLRRALAETFAVSKKLRSASNRAGVGADHVHGYWSIDLGVLHTTAREQLYAFTDELRHVLRGLQSDV